MSKRRGMYKEYIQILPAADSGTVTPVVSEEGYVGLRAVAPAEAPGTSPASAEGAEDPPCEPRAPHVLTAPMVELRLPPPGRARRPAAVPKNRRAPTEGRVALIAATLALALSTGALTWTILSQPRASADMATLAAALAEVQARVAAADGQAQATDARLGRIVERLERTEQAQAEVASQLATLDSGLDGRIATAAKAALTAALPSPNIVTASLSLRPSVEPPPAQPIRPVEPAPAKRPVAAGWVLREAADGTALVEGRRGMFEVGVGSPLPGLGRVVAIEKRDGRMVVVTPRGLIVPPEAD
ncbi:hypothetical protein [Blastochloris sulfoviridis]|uniref:Uncharacterized protein n=1 Tax=Blastochloris sulfoviridis TaxID=50712 RepID=A0A5M6I2C5_9HYPH|nr:hypothetical protein [Blastochloris sulfoviridis]KAA5602354.1 hypothetical protein F1193_05470 [Blastochloris sulfoviridis]